MDGKKMFETYSKMHIYYSALKEIDLKNQYSKGKDFSTSSNSGQDQLYIPQIHDDFYLQKNNYFDEFKKSKTTDQR